MKTDNVERIMDYLAGRLDSQKKKEFEKELRSDSQLNELLVVMKEISGQVHDRNWIDLKGPAHALMDRLLSDVPKTAGIDPPYRGLATFDSRLLPLPEGVRPASVDVCRLKYSMGPYRIELSCHPLSTSTYEVMGQIEGWDQQALPAIVLSDNDVRLKTMANQFAIFRFNRVPIGSYRLKLSIDNNEIGDLSFDL